MPDEIVEKILVLSVQSSDEAISTFNKLPLSCYRFSTLLQKRSHYLFPRVHLQFSRKDLKKVDDITERLKSEFEKS